MLTKKRHTLPALLAALVAAVPIVLAPTPALAATCEYFAGPTPSVEADTDGDGQADYRVPSVSDVSVCAQSDVFLHGQPLRLEPCDWWSAGCWRLYVHLQAGVTVDSGFELCRELDNVPTCSRIDQAPWTYYTPSQPVMCIGFDINGEHPCSSGWYFGFE